MHSAAELRGKPRKDRAVHTRCTIDYLSRARHRLRSRRVAFCQSAPHRNTRGYISQSQRLSRRRARRKRFDGRLNIGRDDNNSPVFVQGGIANKKYRIIIAPARESYIRTPVAAVAVAAAAPTFMGVAREPFGGEEKK